MLSRRHTLTALALGGSSIALTATADAQTRGDILARLGLGEATCYLAGFDRPNIRYSVVEKKKPFNQLTGFLASRPDEAGIVYALSRKRVEEVAGKLCAAGIKAVVELWRRSRARKDPPAPGPAS